MRNFYHYLFYYNSYPGTRQAEFEKIELLFVETRARLVHGNFENLAVSDCAPEIPSTEFGN